MRYAMGLAAGLLCAAAGLRSQDAAHAIDVSRTINVNGEAVIYVVPDEAIVRLGIETFDPSLSRAKSANDERGRELVTAVRSAGVEEKNVQADHAEVEIVYPRDGVAAGVAGYRIRRAYAITLKDPRRLDDLITAALKNGANHLAGYELRTTELRKHRDEARKRAIQAAKEKAEALARELNCDLGAPRSIGEGYYGWFGTRGSWGGWQGGPSQMTQNVSVSEGGDSGEGNTLAPLGQIGVRAQVGVTFDLVPSAARPVR